MDVFAEQIGEQVHTRTYKVQCSPRVITGIAFFFSLIAGSGAKLYGFAVSFVTVIVHDQ